MPLQVVFIEYNITDEFANELRRAGTLINQMKIENHMHVMEYRFESGYTYFITEQNKLMLADMRVTKD